jgi:hypothetical protein
VRTVRETTLKCFRFSRCSQSFAPSCRLTTLVQRKRAEVKSHRPRQWQTRTIKLARVRQWGHCLYGHVPRSDKKWHLAEQEAPSRLWRISNTSLLSGDSVKRNGFQARPYWMVAEGESGQGLDLLNQLVRAFVVAELETHSNHALA